MSSCEGLLVSISNFYFSSTFWRLTTHRCITWWTILDWSTVALSSSCESAKQKLPWNVWLVCLQLTRPFIPIDNNRCTIYIYCFEDANTAGDLSVGVSTWSNGCCVNLIKRFHELVKVVGWVDFNKWRRSILPMIVVCWLSNSKTHVDMVCMSSRRDNRKEQMFNSFWN